MDRYIDAEKAFNSVDTSVINSQYAISIIKSAPTEDVAPVVHAHWEHKLVPRLGYPVPICSHCGESRRETSDFCPDCGAKMDEEVQ